MVLAPKLGAVSVVLAAKVWVAVLSRLSVAVTVMVAVPAAWLRGAARVRAAPVTLVVTLAVSLEEAV